MTERPAPAGWQVCNVCDIGSSHQQHRQHRSTHIVSSFNFFASLTDSAFKYLFIIIFLTYYSQRPLSDHLMFVRAVLFTK